MNSVRLAITFEEFELLPRRLGWKHEYYDGMVHLQPNHKVVIARIAVQPRPEPQWPVRPVTEADAPDLRALFVVSFGDTVEYCDWKPDAIVASAEKCIGEYFNGRRGRPHDASCVVEIDGAVVGAALVVIPSHESGRGQWPGPHALLDMLFVDPAWQRRGIATALMDAVMNALHGDGVTLLASRYVLANAESRAWHQRYGFEDEPDLTIAQERLSIARHALWRWEQLGGLTDEERAALQRDVDYWHREHERLEALADAGDFFDVVPFMHYR